MATKEQEITYKNILELYNLAEELLDSVKSEKDITKALQKLQYIEPFISESVNFSELISENYIKIINGNNNPQIKEDLAKYIAEIINSLTKCNNQLELNTK